MALFCRAGDKPPPRTLVRGFGFFGAGDRFFIAELALPLRKRADVVRQLEDVRFRSVSPFFEFMSARRGPQGHCRWVVESPLRRVLWRPRPGDAPQFAIPPVFGRLPVTPARRRRFIDVKINADGD